MGALRRLQPRLRRAEFFVGHYDHNKEPAGDATLANSGGQKIFQICGPVYEDFFTAKWTRDFSNNKRKQ